MIAETFVAHDRSQPPFGLSLSKPVLSEAEGPVLSVSKWPCAHSDMPFDKLRANGDFVMCNGNLKKPFFRSALAMLGMVSAVAWAAETPASLMAHYAQAAGVPVSALSAARGEALYRTEHAGRNGQTVSCANCHTANPKQPGQTRVGKRIEPLAPAANPERFTDAAKVEKWFRRNCMDVLQRECGAQEKGDFIAWLNQVK